MSEENNKTDEIPVEDKDVQENKVMGIISYISILFVVPLLTKKDSKFAMFHAKQGMVIFIGEVIAYLAYMIPVVGAITGSALSIILLVFAIMGIINAANGKAKKLPVISDIADKFNI